MVKLSLFRHAWVFAAIAAVLTLAAAAGQDAGGAPASAVADNVGALCPDHLSDGRTGEVATVRFVAQIKPLPDSVLSPVQFFVDGKLLATINAPPYATDWVDENPFIDTELTISVADNLGHTASDKVAWRFEITDLTEVSRVLLDTMVLDKDGGCSQPRSQQLHRARRRCAAGARSRRPGSLASDVCHVGRQQPEHVTADRLRPRGGQSTRRLHAPQGSDADRSLLEEARADYRADRRPRDGVRRDLEGPAAGRTAIIDSLIELAPQGADSRGRAIVLITDGYDEHSESNYEDALEAVKAVQATSTSSGSGGSPGSRCKANGSSSGSPRKQADVRFCRAARKNRTGHTDVLASDVQNRYLLSYTPQNKTLDGKWRAITVSTNSEEHLSSGRETVTSRRNRRRCGPRWSSPSPTTTDSPKWSPTTSPLSRTASNRSSRRSRRRSARFRFCSRSTRAAA